MGNKTKTIMVFAGGLALAWLAAETALLAYFGFHTPRIPHFPAINRPAATYDPVRGYNAHPGSTRAVRLFQDQLIYDNEFSINSQGWFSKRDYSLEKTNPQTFRIAVFGDSFTAPVYLETSWPDQVHKLLNQQNPGRFEVYNFGLDGTGIFNWHEIFFRELSPGYDFDALIIAGFADNLDRGFSVWHCTDRQSRFGRFEKPAATPEEFTRDYWPFMQTNFLVEQDRAIDRTIALAQEGRGSWRWPGLMPRVPGYLVQRLLPSPTQRMIRKQRKKIRKMAAMKPGPVTFGDRELANLVDARAWNMLLDMANACRVKEIPVILAPIPSREGAQNAAREPEGWCWHQNLYYTLAKKLDVGYFDGYRVFSGVDPKDMDIKYWLPMDGHWNQAGSDLFAQKLAAWIQTRGPGPANHKPPVPQAQESP